MTWRLYSFVNWLFSVGEGGRGEEGGSLGVVWERRGELGGLLAGSYTISSTSESWLFLVFFLLLISTFFYDTKSQPRGRNSKTRRKEGRGRGWEEGANDKLGGEKTCGRKGRVMSHY